MRLGHGATFLFMLAFGCIGEVKTDTTDTSADTCETLPNRSCGYGAAETGDTGCPDGYSCWGPSTYQCYRGDCNLPECLPPHTAIDTPDGPRPVADLVVGDLVYTLSVDGKSVIAPIVKVGSRRAPVDQQVVDLILSDGRHVSGSPGHPTADGGRIGRLRAGQPFDGATILSADLVPYAHARTWDLRPDGATGAYWAEGVLLGSTLSAR